MSGLDLPLRQAVLNQDARIRDLERIVAVLIGWLGGEVEIAESELRDMENPELVMMEGFETCSLIIRARAR